MVVVMVNRGPGLGGVVRVSGPISRGRAEGTMTGPFAETKRGDRDLEMCRGDHDGCDDVER